MRFKTLPVLLCAFLMSPPVFPQASGQGLPVQKPQEKKDDSELRQKALAMLEEVIADVPSFKLPENRMRLMSTAADLLWQEDEKRARALFLEAGGLLTQIIRQAEELPESIPDNFRWSFNQQRQEVVQLVAQHDAQLAHDLLVATRPVANEKTGLYNPEHESQIELMLAQQSISQDPKRALQMAKDRLATASSPNVVSNILYSLREKDSAAAQELADAIVAKLKSEGQLNQESASFAINLLALAPPPFTPGGEGVRPSGNQTPLITPAGARDLIEKAIATIQTQLAAVKRQNDQGQRYNVINLVNQLKSMMPYVEKYAPASVAALKRSLPEADQMKDSNQRRWDELNSLAEKNSPELLIEAASKADPEMKLGYYQRAAQLARDKGDTERARQIISDNVTDFNQRRQALYEVNQQRLWQSISEGKFDEARGLLGGLRNVQERVNALTQMAAAAMNGEKKDLAAQFLNEAWAMVDGPAETNQQFGSQLQIATAYVKINPARSFEIIEATIDQYNELFAASAVLENFEQNGSFREKEMVLLNGGRASAYLYPYGQALAELARADAPRVQAVIRKIARPEPRAGVRLFVLNLILRSRPNYGVGGFERRGLRSLD